MALGFAFEKCNIRFVITSVQKEGFILKNLNSLFSFNSFVFLFLSLFFLPDTCSSPCVSGVCTAKDKCSCDRGFEGSNCNQTATTGKMLEGI